MTLKRFGAFIVLAAAVGGAFLWFYHQSQETKRKEQERQAQEEQTKQHISQFAAQYHAITDWRENLNHERTFRTVYSADLTPVFVRSDQRPLLFIVSVKDVTLQNSEYTIHSEAQVNLGNSVILELRATPEHANLVMKDSHSRAVFVPLTLN